MSMGLCYWVLMLVALVFGGSIGWRNRATGGVLYGGGGLILFILLVLLGWKVFGAPVHG